MVIYGDNIQAQINMLKNHLKEFSDAPFSENVAIHSIEEYGDFLVLDTSEIININELVKQSIDSSERYDELVSLVNEMMQRSNKNL